MPTWSKVFAKWPESVEIKKFWSSLILGLTQESGSDDSEEWQDSSKNSEASHASEQLKFDVSNN